MTRDRGNDGTGGGQRWGEPGQPGPVALVGSGEYLPAMAGVDRLLLAGRPPVYVQVPTAAAPEGPRRLRYWIDLGVEHARRLGVRAVPVAVTSAGQAEDPAAGEAVRGAGLVYLSGGSPAYLAATLRGSAFWRAVDKEWRAGAALAGCSAGAMALTGWVPSVRDPGVAAVAGLNVVPHLRVIPHYDTFRVRFPDLTARYLDNCPAGVSVLGIDEDTALIGGPRRWSVRGRGSVWVLTARGATEQPAGAEVLTPA